MVEDITDEVLLEKLLDEYGENRQYADKLEKESKKK